MSEPEDKNLVSKGTTTGVGYSIEVRLTDGASPYKYGNMIIDSNWRTLSLVNSDDGVLSRLMSEEIKHHGIVSYEAAMSLAYKFLASDWRTLSEVRLVKHKYVVTHLITKDEEMTPIQPSWMTRKS